MQSKEDIKQQLFAKIVQWQQSGLAQKAFCLQLTDLFGIAYLQINLLSTK